MKPQLHLKSLRSRLILWFLVVALIPLLSVGLISYSQRAVSIKNRELNKLLAIRDLKAEQVRSWIRYRIIDIETISMTPEIQDLVDTADFIHNETASQSLTDRIRRLLLRYVTNYPDYDELFILHPMSGKIVISTDKSLEGEIRKDNAYFTEPVKIHRPYIKDIYISQTINRLSMTFSVPIPSGLDRKNMNAGVLVARVDPEHSVFELLRQRGGLGKSGETFLVNDAGVVLSELRWEAHAPLRMVFKGFADESAGEKPCGISETVDYRGNSVLMAYAHIPEIGWKMVAKQDMDEVYLPAKKMWIDFFILILFSFVVVVIAASWLSNSIARPVIEMAQVAGKIKEGDFSARNKILIDDELGYLARAFNRMIESLTFQMTVEKGITDINETMTAVRELSDFRRNLLQKLMTVTRSDLGAYYLLNTENDMFEPYISIGMTSERLRPFRSDTPEGQFAEPLSTRRIAHIKDIPEGTAFVFQTFAGVLLPREIVSIPVKSGHRVSAMISIAAYKPYSEESIRILEHTWPAINAAVANMIAVEKTRALASELQIKNRELETKSQTLMEQNIELERQRLKIAEANRLKDEFLSNMSHELRTPLNSIMALSKVLILQTRDKLDEEESNYLQIISRNGKNLLDLINDILDLSKIEAGRMDLKPKPISLLSITETIAERLEPIAKEKGIRIGVHFVEGVPWIVNDEQRIHQILQNIVSNAVKFTEHGEVRIAGSCDGQSVYVVVEDTGIGISEKDLPYIFDEFRQVDGTASRKFEGTGLGLAIAYKSARLIGGNVTVKSVPGSGSIFTFSVPVTCPETENQSCVSHEKPALTDAKKRVLVVDDDRQVVEMIACYLEEEGYDVIKAFSGKEAIESAVADTPFAITLDVFMPDMDGWEVLQVLKRHPRTINTPVIIVSVSEDNETGFALGAIGYVMKPVNRESLLAEVRKSEKHGNHPEYEQTDV